MHLMKTENRRVWIARRQNDLIWFGAETSYVGNVAYVIILNLALKGLSHIWYFKLNCHGQGAQLNFPIRISSSVFEKTVYLPHSNKIVKKKSSCWEVDSCLWHLCMFNRDHSPLLPFGDATVPQVVNCAFESQRRLYLNVNLMTALNYKTRMVQTLKLN